MNDADLMRAVDSKIAALDQEITVGEQLVAVQEHQLRDSQFHLGRLRAMRKRLHQFREVQADNAAPEPDNIPL